MSTLHNIRIVAIAACLLPFAVSCGEIELPTNDDKVTPEEPAPPPEEKPAEDVPSPEEKDPPSPDGEENDDNDDDNDSDDDDDNDNDDDDAATGTAVLTDDGHIVIDGRLYLSVIEYVDIKGDEATSAEKNAESYVEGTLEGWRIPTEEDAKILTAILTSEHQWYSSSALALLNHALEESDLEDYQLITLYEGTGENPSPIYYLCNGGKNAYTYAAGTTQPFIAVSDNKKYRLRLVKDK